MPEGDEEVQRQVEEVFASGFKPYLWHICVARAVLAGEDVITVAPTGKSLTYWIPLLYIKHGITNSQL